VTVVRRPNDPEHVVRRYETEEGLAARRAVYRAASGPDAPGLAVELGSSERPSGALARLPETLDALLIARRLPAVVVASA
jgi:hypothetical protein